MKLFPIRDYLFRGFCMFSVIVAIFMLIAAMIIHGSGNGIWGFIVAFIICIPAICYDLGLLTKWRIVDGFYNYSQDEIEALLEFHKDMK